MHKTKHHSKEITKTPRSFTSAEIAGLSFGLIAILAIIIGLAVGLTVNSGSTKPVTGSASA